MTQTQNLSEQQLQFQIRSRISQLTATPADQIAGSDRLREDLGLDSISSLELVSMLAEEFRLDVDLEEAMQVQDVAGLTRMALRYLGMAK